MRKKFKIMYPSNYWDAEKAGKPYLPPAHCQVVMSNGGVFYLWDNTPFYSSVRKLSEVLYSYDVIWKE